MFKGILKALKKFFDFKTAMMCVIGLLALISALSRGDAATSMWIFSATAWVAISRVNECSREDVRVRCSELFDLMCRKENIFKDSVSEINRSWESKLKEKEAEAASLRERLEEVTQKYKEAEAKNVQLSSAGPATLGTVKGKEKTEYTEKDIARIKAELRAAGLMKEEE